MDENMKQELALRFLRVIQQEQSRPHPPSPSDKMRGAPMILHYIKTHGGAVSPSEISKAIGISTARITAVLGNLEKKGLLVRTMDENDRRKIRITLTEVGQSHVEKMERDIMTNFRSLVEYLGEEDTCMAIRILEKLRDWKPDGLCEPEDLC